MSCNHKGLFGRSLWELRRTIWPYPYGYVWLCSDCRLWDTMPYRDDACGSKDEAKRIAKQNEPNLPTNSKDGNDAE